MGRGTGMPRKSVAGTGSKLTRKVTFVAQNKPYALIKHLKADEAMSPHNGIRPSEQRGKSNERVRHATSYPLVQNGKKAEIATAIYRRKNTTVLASDDRQTQGPQHQTAFKFGARANSNLSINNVESKEPQSATMHKRKNSSKLSGSPANLINRQPKTIIL